MFVEQRAGGRGHQVEGTPSVFSAAQPVRSADLLDILVAPWLVGDANKRICAGLSMRGAIDHFTPQVPGEIEP